MKRMGGPQKRQAPECEARWEAVVRHTAVKGPWLPEEDSLLRQLVNKFGPKRWALIASHIPGRAGKQCRERWLNHLDTRVIKSDWTPDEDAVLLEQRSSAWLNERVGEIARLLPGQRGEIARLLPGRAENAVKNRFNSLITKRLTHGLEAAAAGGGGGAAGGGDGFGGGGAAGDDRAPEDEDLSGKSAKELLALMFRRVGETGHVAQRQPNLAAPRGRPAGGDDLCEVDDAEAAPSLSPDWEAVEEKATQVAHEDPGYIGMVVAVAAGAGGAELLRRSAPTPEKHVRGPRCATRRARAPGRRRHVRRGRGRRAQAPGPGEEAPRPPPVGDVDGLAMRLSGTLCSLSLDDASWLGDVIDGTFDPVAAQRAEATGRASRDWHVQSMSTSLSGGKPPLAPASSSLKMSASIDDWGAPSWAAPSCRRAAAASSSQDAAGRGSFGLGVAELPLTGMSPRSEAQVTTTLKEMHGRPRGAFETPAGGSNDTSMSLDNVDWDLILKMSNTPRGAGLDKSLDKKLLSKASIDFDPLAATAKPGGAPGTTPLALRDARPQ
ncbi:RNA polymerase II transcription regulator recruiting protein [Aureococcus anophagefferens]|nr:RNA polymerase II transcription regulator recruiting protein [Aureococcus anophagefferens]